VQPNQPPTDGRRLIAVSSYGGQARQYRVQIFCTATQQWQRWATYSDQHQADKCARQCTEDGYDVRVVEFAITPAAA
jgi:hypothetical protein